MANTTKNAGLGANGAGGGSSTWTDPNNITASDNSYAVIPGPHGFSSTDLDCTNFGFNIPTGSTINGISVHIERYAGGQVSDTSIKLLNGDGAGGESAQDKSTGAAWSATEGVVTFGGSNETWGESWTASDINSSSFGVRLQCGGDTTYYDTDSAYLANVQITVYFASPLAAGDAEIKEIRIGDVPLSNIAAGATAL